MASRPGQHPPGPRWKEPFKFGKPPKDGRFLYEDGDLKAWVTEKVNDYWLWAVYKKGEIVAVGSEEVLYRAKHQAKLALEEQKTC